MAQYQFEIAVEPRYLPDQSAPAERIYSFSYTITITNKGETAAQLISRHWLINDASGHGEEVKGLGVIGAQPFLRPGESFQYTSGCRLRTPTGTMHGTYFFVAENADRFEVVIPLFVLEAESGGAASRRVLH